MRLPDPLVPPEPWPGIIARFWHGVAIHLARPAESWDQLTSSPVRWIQTSVRDHYQLVKPQHVASLAAELLQDVDRPETMAH